MNASANNLLTLASAGSGKTYKLSNRVIELVALGHSPESIVALTFTRKAAGEFADAVLTKLATAASDEKAAAELRRFIGQPDADFRKILAEVTRALPRFTLGTIDSFFAKVVRNFPYELGLANGEFDLLEGPRAEAARDRLISELLSDTLSEEIGEAFLQAFRRASIGKEGQKVGDGLRHFIDEWQSRYRRNKTARWGPPELAGVDFHEWEKQKISLIDKVRRGLGGIEETRKGQTDALRKLLDLLENHTIGSGSLSGAGKLFQCLMEKAADLHGPLELKSHKEFIVPGPAGEALRALANLLARCETAASLARTRAIVEVVAMIDAAHEETLRRHGKLGFDDVKLLMAAWATSEDARLRREEVDFRLGSRYDHWLLDEFQDTSREDWTGLFPLIDESATNGRGTTFIVGDKKQAIYAWRGGEVKLFDEIIERYRGDQRIDHMAESWRSCPEVLDLVNRVCGDESTLHRLFPLAAIDWQWEPHRSAPPHSAPGRGEARVEIVGKEIVGKEFDEKLVRLGEILEDLEVRKRSISCGVLLRSNSQVRLVADHLRGAGFDVIEEGSREPASDNPVGIALCQLLKWLANPADTWAAEAIAMSPLADVLRETYGEKWQTCWETLNTRASETGFSGMIGEIIETLWPRLSEFGKRRSGDLLAALGQLDAQGVVTAREAAEWIERLEVSQNPGTAAVQVMTIHKSKGLDFDVVILPEISSDSIPNNLYFSIVEGDGWLTQPPPKWARFAFPEILAAEERWTARQQYEAICMLYVALTRAKRGLYVLLSPPPATGDADKPSLENWLATSLDSDGNQGIIYQNGNPLWWEAYPHLTAKPENTTTPSLLPAAPRRDRMTPSGTKATATPANVTGMAYGRTIHEAFERIAWLDESPDSEIPHEIEALLEIPSIRRLFEKSGRTIDLLREQTLDALVHGKWMSGTLDRLHIHRDSKGNAILIEIIDFKTDAVEHFPILLERYSPQMEAYRSAIQAIYPNAKIECLLLSTHLREAGLMVES
ncbi:MAG: UvrD-helicase domain-containing protein [Luteolibacter sp.]